MRERRNIINVYGIFNKISWFQQLYETSTRMLKEECGDVNLVLPSEQNIGESEQDMKISYEDKSNLMRFLVIVW